MDASFFGGPNERTKGALVLCPCLRMKLARSV